MPTKAELKTRAQHALMEVEELLFALASMSKPFLPICRDILTKLHAHSSIHPFLLPVKVVGYSKIIKHPICISDIDAKTKAATYSEARGFIADLRLMVENCFTFNGAEAPVSAQARSVEITFEQLFVECLNEPRPDTSSFLNMCRRLNEAQRHALVRIITSYEAGSTEVRGGKFNFKPELLKHATNRRVKLFLEKCWRENVAQQQEEQHPQAPVAPPHKVARWEGSNAVAAQASKVQQRRLAKSALTVAAADDDDEFFRTVLEEPDPGAASTVKLAAEANAAAARGRAAKPPLRRLGNRHDVEFTYEGSPISNAYDDEEVEEAGGPESIAGFSGDAPAANSSQVLGSDGRGVVGDGDCLPFAGHSEGAPVVPRVDQPALEVGNGEDSLTYFNALEDTELLPSFEDDAKFGTSEGP